MDWWAPRVMPTPRSWPPTISTSRAYCKTDVCYHIRLVALCWRGCLTQLATIQYLLMCMCYRVNIHKSDHAGIPVCLRGQGRPGQLAPAGQRHPSPSGPPWCDLLPSPRCRSWQDHSPPANRKQTHGGWGVSMRSDKYIWELKEVWNYLKEFGDRPHKLSKKLLLLLIHGYGTDKSHYTTTTFFSSTELFNETLPIFQILS